MGGVGLVVCQGFLVREACVCVLVGGAGFPLSLYLVCIVVFGVAYLCFGSLWSSLYGSFLTVGGGWTGGLSRFLG